MAPFDDGNSGLFVLMSRFFCCFQIEVACTLASLPASSDCAYRQGNRQSSALNPGVRVQR